MADQPIAPTFIDVDTSETQTPLNPVIAPPMWTAASTPETRPAERQKRLVATLDLPLLVVVTGLLAIGLMMVYSTTFDWSYQSYGSDLVIFFQHVRNLIIGSVIMVLLIFIDYRVWKRFAIWMLLVVISMLIAVLIFGDDTFGARRALINGSFQPGEAAELVIVIYMAAWLGSRRTQIRSITYGLIPFAMLVGIVGGLVMLQPDLSTAAMIFIASGIMFFLAGADIKQLGVAGVLAGVMGFVVARLGLLPSYAEDRVSSFLSGLNNLTQAHYQVQQAVIAFLNGGWTGVGLGEGRQKFGFLPAPHTDSIFAVIGEELGVIGATVVVLLYVAFVIRGFQISRRAIDPFGALLASGMTVWVVSKALLNIAVMTAVVPPTGAVLPFISFGGSSLVVLMAGTGLLLSVARVRTRLDNAPERRNAVANYDSGGRNRRPRISSAGSGRSNRPAN
jgi:cell division protein FtsW